MFPRQTWPVFTRLSMFPWQTLFNSLVFTRLSFLGRLGVSSADLASVYPSQYVSSADVNSPVFPRLSTFPPQTLFNSPVFTRLSIFPRKTSPVFPRKFRLQMTVFFRKSVQVAADFVLPVNGCHKDSVRCERCGHSVSQISAVDRSGRGGGWGVGKNNGRTMPLSRSSVFRTDSCRRLCLLRKPSLMSDIYTRVLHIYNDTQSCVNHTHTLTHTHTHTHTRTHTRTHARTHARTHT